MRRASARKSHMKKSIAKCDNAIKLDSVYTLIEEIEEIREKMENTRSRLLDSSITDRAQDMGVARIPVVHIRSIHVLKAHSSRIHDAFWSPLDDYIVSVGSENCIVLWNTLNGSIHNVVDASLQQPVAADVTEDMKNIFCGGLCSRVVIYKRFPPQVDPEVSVPDAAAPVSTIRGEAPPDDCYSEYDVCNTLDHDSNILRVKYLGNNMLATVAEQEGLLIWDLEKTKKKHCFKTVVGQTTAFVNLKQKGLYATGSTYGIVTLWDDRVKDYEVMMMEAHESDVTCLEALPSCNNFLSGSDDTFVQLFDIRMDAAIARYSDPVWKNLETKLENLDGGCIRPDLPTVNTIACTPSGRMFLTGCGDGFMYFWDTLHSMESLLQREEGGPIKKLAISSQGSALISVVWDNRHRIKVFQP